VEIQAGVVSDSDSRTRRNTGAADPQKRLAPAELEDGSVGSSQPPFPKDCESTNARCEPHRCREIADDQFVRAGREVSTSHAVCCSSPFVIDLPPSGPQLRASERPETHEPLTYDVANTSNRDTEATV
jgi:hypothetical protein